MFSAVARQQQVRTEALDRRRILNIITPGVWRRRQDAARCAPSTRVTACRQTSCTQQPLVRAHGRGARSPQARAMACVNRVALRGSRCLSRAASGSLPGQPRGPPDLSGSPVSPPAIDHRRTPECGLPSTTGGASHDPARVRAATGGRNAVPAYMFSNGQTAPRWPIAASHEMLDGLSERQVGAVLAARLTS